MDIKKIFCLILCLASFITFSFARQAASQPVSLEDGKAVVLNWLQLKDQHFGASMGMAISKVALYRGGMSGNIGYYLVILNPTGWIILPADDEYWPIQAFGSGKMTSERFEESFWYKTVRYNVDPAKKVQRFLSPKQQAKTEAEILHNRKAWELLTSLNEVGDLGFYAVPPRKNLPSNTTVRVPEFLGSSSEWGQGSPFNFRIAFTDFAAGSTDLVAKIASNNVAYPFQDPPPHADSSPDLDSTGRHFTYNSYSVGCTALATGQTLHHIMTFGDFDELDPSHLKPVELPLMHNIRFAYILYNAPLPYYWAQEMSSLDKGGSLFDYKWENMHYTGDPRTASSTNTSAGDQIKKYIAPMLRDVGLLSGNTEYSPEESSGTSGTAIAEVYNKMGFHHASHMFLQPYRNNNETSSPPLPTNAVQKIILPNLDIRLPVVASFQITDTNKTKYHVAVVDGYAFENISTDGQTFTPYYHLCPGDSEYTPGSSGLWSIDPGGWSYGLQKSYEEVGPGIDDNLKLIGLTFNLIPSVRAYAKAGPTGPNREANFPINENTNEEMPVEIVSGRVLIKDSQASTATETIYVGQQDASVEVSWQGSMPYTASTDANGIYAFVVPSGATISLNVTSPDGLYWGIWPNGTKTVIR